MRHFYFLVWLIVSFISPALAQVPEKFTKPIPLDGGEASELNVNRIQFFRQPGVSDSTANFQEALSHLEYGDNQTINLFDILGTPGSAVSDVKREPANVLELLADPAGLCYENFLMNLVCTPGWLSMPANHPSWQLLLADVRHYLPGEAPKADLDPEVANIAFNGLPDAPPYDKFGLSGLVANLGEDQTSPEAICYDIASAEDWIACPVFGKIFVRKNVLDVVEMHSPIMLFRQEQDNRYHLDGYLANPLYFQFNAYGPANPNLPLRIVYADFPMSIAAGTFVTSEAEANLDTTMTDIAVMGTATLSHASCRWLNLMMVEKGLPSWPWKLNCTNGLVWSRIQPGWGQPVRSSFDSSHFLVGGPGIYDMATAKDAGHTKLLAAGNVPSDDGKYYVLKYFDLPWIDPGLPFFGKIVPPRLIEVTPPAGNNDYGPFRIEACQINDDGLADFAITWKKTNDTLVNTEHRIWKGNHSSWFSVFVTRQGENGLVYDQFDFQVPKVDSPLEWDSEAQLAAIACGQKGTQKYLVVGNNKRVAVNGGHYAFAFLFPIADGLVNNLQVQSFQVSFQSGEADQAGVGDLITQPSSFVVSAVIRDPLLRAPESCNVSDNQAVYGHLWLGPAYGDGGQEIYYRDADNDGVPNRCEACSLDNPEAEDSDGDELPDVEGCDLCPGKADLNLELNNDGQIVGDGVPDACDNCPPQRCAQHAYELKSQDCINPNQIDGDQDGVGDTCDGCPTTASLTQKGVYFWGAPGSGDCFLTSGCFVADSERFCTYCVNGYVKSNGEEWADITWFGSGRCNLTEITAPGGLSELDDVDQDGVPNERDNCVQVSNPSPQEFIGSKANQPTGQADSDGDGSGDACDCEWAGQWDDCDSDGVPNRFDKAPYNPAVSFKLLAPPDSVYDPYAGVIADRSELRPAQMTVKDLQEQVKKAIKQGIEESIKNLDLTPWEGQPQPILQTKICGYLDKTYPGLRPCENMGLSGKEVTVILPSKAEEVPPPPECKVGVDPECTPKESPPTPDEPTAGRNIAQYCIATVGRPNPKTAALFESDQAQIIAANQRAEQITGLKDFDIFVGAEGGMIHWECAFLAGAFPSAAKATNIIPDVSGNVAPFLVAQTSGMPPLRYERRPDPQLAIKAPNALLLAPLPDASTPVDASFALAPSLNQALAGYQVKRLPSAGVQFGTLSENINGNMVVKVLTAKSEDSSAVGTFLSVGELHNLAVFDWKAYAEPWSFEPVEKRRGNPELLLKELQEKADLWRQIGRPITPEIYRGLAWSDKMYAEFLVVQTTVQEAVVEANKSVTVGPDQSEQLLPDDYVHQVYLPAYVKRMSYGIGGGCGCKVSSETTGSAAALFTLFCLIVPLPVLMYCRQKMSLRGTPRLRSG